MKGTVASFLKAESVVGPYKDGKNGPEVF